MNITAPFNLLLLIPFIIFFLIFISRQLYAIRKLKELVSPRFLSTFTIYSSKRLVIVHFALVFFAGLLCIIASAGPERSGGQYEEGERRNIIFALDASLSMTADDVILPAGIEEATSRMSLATETTRYIISRMNDSRFALISFSGKGVIHSPLTTDTFALDTYLSSFTTHNYRNMGTDFKEALKSALYLMRDTNEFYQIVLFSDGEEVNGSKYNEEISVLKKSGIPVHSIVLGGKEKLSYDLYAPKDVVNRKEEKTIAKTVTFGRDVKTMSSIAKQTGGRTFILNETKSLQEIIEELSNREYEGVSKEKNLSHFFLSLFALLFFGEILVSAYMRNQSRKRSGMKI